jgi:hypothetical protein
MPTFNASSRTAELWAARRALEEAETELRRACDRYIACEDPGGFRALGADLRRAAHRLVAAVELLISARSSSRAN